jgi:hypothetical protein
VLSDVILQRFSSWEIRLEYRTFALIDQGPKKDAQDLFTASGNMVVYCVSFPTDLRAGRDFISLENKANSG